MKSSLPTVVVTGIGVVSPLGHTPLEMWQRLLAGESSARPWEDLAADGYRVTTACRIEDFDCSPLRRGGSLTLTAVQGAVEDAALRLPDDTGVFIGSTMGESFAFERAAEGDPLSLGDLTVPSFARAIQAHFRLTGPTQSLATACAAGNYAVGAALSRAACWTSDGGGCWWG